LAIFFSAKILPKSLIDLFENKFAQFLQKIARCLKNLPNAKKFAQCQKIAQMSKFRSIWSPCHYGRACAKIALIASNLQLIFVAQASVFYGH
jgi:hypothetical protein